VVSTGIVVVAGVWLVDVAAVVVVSEGPVHEVTTTRAAASQ
jgi:hypothetical protein